MLAWFGDSMASPQQCHSTKSTRQSAGGEMTTEAVSYETLV